MLNNRDIVELTALRQHLHRFPELSGQEAETARRIAANLAALNPDQLITGLGGHGIAGVFDGAAPGETVLVRCELDALPIHEMSVVPHRSTVAGKGHLCGHDGHMVTVLALGRLLSRQRPARGRVVLLFQPAEEDGSGAAAVITDPAFQALRPDWAFALHNMPGLARGRCRLAAGPINCASVGLKIQLEGKTSHAAQPEAGLSPGHAMAQLIAQFAHLSSGAGALGPDYRLATVTHARLGEPSFGISPGSSEIRVTLRTVLDGAMAGLKARSEQLAAQAIAGTGLKLSVSYHDDFAASVNDRAATALVAQALTALEIPFGAEDLPMRASEDFGRFGSLPGTKAAMFLLGAGDSHPALHNPDYDFPDDLIAVGASVFHQLTRKILG